MQERKVSMKKFLIPVLVLIMLLTSFTPAYARGGGGAGDVVRVNGVITAIDAPNMSFTIQVDSGEYKGQDITVQTTNRTKYAWKVSDDGCVSITFNDLKIDQEVGVTGTFDGNDFYARKVVVQWPLYPGD